MPSLRSLALSLCIATVAVAQQSVVQGRVVDMLGEPMPTVRLRVLAADGKELRSSATDGDGMFVLPKLPEEPLQVCIEAPGKLTRRCIAPVGPERRALRWQLDDAAPLRGRVVDASGAPLTGVHITAQGNASLWSTDAISDAQGDFTFAQVPLVELQVRAWAPGFLLTTAAWRGGKDERLELLLTSTDAPPQRVHVDGIPAGATAMLTFEGERVLPLPLRQLACDAHGDAVVPPFEPKMPRVGVLCPRCSSTPELAPLTATPVRLLLEPIAASLIDPHTTARFRIVDDTGNPLPNLTVACSKNGRDELARATTDGLGVATFTLPLAKYVSCSVAIVDSLWRLDGPAASEPRVWGAQVCADPDEIRVLKAHLAGGVTGRALSTDGRALPFAPIEVYRAVSDAGRRRAPFDYPEQLVLRSATDRDGNFAALGLPAGNYVVVVRDDTVCARKEVRLVDGNAMTVNTWDLEPLGRVRGVLRDGSGRPLAGVGISATFATQDRSDVLRPDHRIAVVTDRDGRYCLRGLRDGDHDVLAHGNRGTTRVTVTAGRTQTLDLEANR